MASDVLKIDRVGAHVLKVTIDRPEKRNAITGEVASGIDHAVKLAESDLEIRAVVLASAAGGVFCAGADLGEVAAGRHAGLQTPDGGFAGIVEARRTKPWIVAVDGLALAGGCEICLACDLIIASESASFGLPEAKRGLMAGAGGVFRLPRKVPAAIATEMLLTGDPIGALRAYEIGLVNRVVPAGEALSAALELAARIAANAPISVQQSLKVATLARTRDEAELFAIMREAGAAVRNSEDFKEGPRAFLEKREPRWTGR